MEKVYKIGTFNSISFVWTLCCLSAFPAGCGNDSNKQPFAEFVFNPAYPLVGETVVFDASASIDPDGMIVEYAFDFADPAPGRWYKTAGPKIDHVFSTPGTYWVRLQVTDDKGAISETAAPVEVGHGTNEAEIEVPEQLKEQRDGSMDGLEFEDADADTAGNEPEAPREGVGIEEDMEYEPELKESVELEEDDGAELKFSGYLAVVEFQGETRTTVSAFAGFSRPMPQDCGYEHQVVTVGDCRVTIIRPDDPGKDCLPPETLSGGVVTITGGIIDPIVLVPKIDERGRVSYESNIDKESDGIFYYSSLLSIDVAGNSEEDVPEITGVLSTPSDFQITSPDVKSPDLRIVPGEPIDVEWSGAVNDQVERMTIVVTAADTDTDVRYDCICTPMDTGSFTVPSQATELIPNGAENVSIMLTRGTHNRLYSEDKGYFMATATLYRGGSAAIGP